MLKVITDPKLYPKGPHYVILKMKTKQIHHQGDQRSIDCPGHGYPAYTENVHECEVTVTENQAEWRDELVKLYKADEKRTDIIGYHVDAVAKVDVSIKID